MFSSQDALNSADEIPAKDEEVCIIIVVLKCT